MTRYIADITAFRITSLLIMVRSTSSITICEDKNQSPALEFKSFLSHGYTIHFFQKKVLKIIVFSRLCKRTCTPMLIRDTMREVLCIQSVRR